MKYIVNGGVYDTPEEAREAIRKEERKERALHYLKVLKNNAGIMQPEIREAIDYAIEEVEK